MTTDKNNTRFRSHVFSANAGQRIILSVGLLIGCGVAYEPSLGAPNLEPTAVHVDPERNPASARVPEPSPSRQPSFEPEPAEALDQRDPFYHDEPEDEREPIPPSSPGSPNTGSPSPRLIDPGSLDVDGHALATMEPQACLARVAELGLAVETASHPAVDAGLRPTGPIGGISLEFGGRRRLHEIMDCRLLLAIHAWAPLLRRIGVRKIRHLSALRPGAIVRTTGRSSGHSRGLAFDPRFFEFDDGRVFDVLEDWDDRTRGGALCEPKNESAESAQIRQAVCAAIEAELFQVVVSPHHNDDHQNHLHLEVVPHARWRWSG